ncbi:MAG: hypothetical protein ACOCP4_03560 [Candidatus Woesearchaeota archaeon]
MHGISQDIFQKIAKKENLKYHLSQVMFRQKESMIDEMEERLTNDLHKAVKMGNDKLNSDEAHEVARRIWDVLPFMLERDAINSYIEEHNDLGLFLMMMPNIDTIDTAIAFLQKEHPYLKKIILNEVEDYLEELPKTLPFNGTYLKQKVIIHKKSDINKIIKQKKQKLSDLRFQRAIKFEELNKRNSLFGDRNKLKWTWQPELFDVRFNPSRKNIFRILKEYDEQIDILKKEINGFEDLLIKDKKKASKSRKEWPGYFTPKGYHPDHGFSYRIDGRISGS